MVILYQAHEILVVSRAFCFVISPWTPTSWFSPTEEIFPRTRMPMQLSGGWPKGPSPGQFPLPCVHEFYSLVTNPKIFKNNKASSPEQALKQLEAWMASPTLQLLGEGQSYFPALMKLLQRGNVRGAMVHDARVFALCESNGVQELWTADRDFSAFAGRVRLHNPLNDP